MSYKSFKFVLERVKEKHRIKWVAVVYYSVACVTEVLGK